MAIELTIRRGEQDRIVGDGPISDLGAFRHTARLDRAGEIALSLPKADRRAWLLTKHVRVDARADYPGGPRFQGAGILDHFASDAGEAGMLRASGGDLLRELLWYPVGDLFLHDIGMASPAKVQRVVPHVQTDPLSDAHDGNPATAATVLLGPDGWLYVLNPYEFDYMEIDLVVPGRAVDGFHRTEAGGLGLSDDGTEWGDYINQALTSVRDGVATFAFDGEALEIAGALDVDALDVDVTVGWRWDRLPSAGTWRVELRARVQEDDAAYVFAAEVDPDGAISLELLAGETVLAAGPSPVMAVPGEWLAMQMRVTGSEPTAVKGRLWNPDPDGPDLFTLGKSLLGGPDILG